MNNNNEFVFEQRCVFFTSVCVCVFENKSKLNEQSQNNKNYNDSNNT